MAICKFYQMDGVGFGSGWLLLGAPNTHRMPTLSNAMHEHGVVSHERFSSHYMSVMSWGLGFVSPC